MNPDDVRNLFLQRIHEDLDAGAAKELAYYQELYPGHESLVAQEYRGLWSESGGAEDFALGAEDVVSEEFLSELRRNSSPSSRYDVGKEVARGGMGAIHEVWDRGLSRRLAMKVVLGASESERAPTTPVRDPRRLARFLEEAQVTGRLDHPGIVPVHELGINSRGDVYFTMRLIEGRDLNEVFKSVHRGEDGWTRTRALNVVLRTCEAMSFAHSKGVIHRDLKPSNVRVGRFGEVYVLDWGLAKMHGREDSHDLRLRSSVDELDPGESALLTMDGTVMGTPAYMPPEQAQGNMGDLGPHSDVYSMGAILYELLAGRAPYAGVGRSSHAVLRALLSGPPRSADEFGTGIPVELLAICERAMAREPSERYSDTRELAEDLRAFLEQRVVSAYETGALAELRKWVQRNRGLSAALLGVVVFALAGLGVSLFLKSQADANARLADSEKNNVLRLSAFQNLEDLTREADSEAMWPLHPDKGPTYKEWLRKARALARGLEHDPKTGTGGHRQLLEELTARVDLHTGAGGEEELQEAWWLAQVGKLVAELEAFSDSETGLIEGDVSPVWGWSVRRRLKYAENMEHDTLTGDEARALWNEAIAFVESEPRYAGLRLKPQLGLLPLGADPGSGWLEFADLQSGVVPRRDKDGQLVITEQTGLVFILLPGGSFAMGSQSSDADAPNYFNPLGSPIEEDEIPVDTVVLSPFFISKYELTQGQWSRFAGANPSSYPPGVSVGGKAVDLRNPVEGVTWFEARRLVTRMGFDLPTEAQWEYAARGATTTPWSYGKTEEHSELYSNVADAFGKKYGPKGLPYETWDDGYALHAPAGTYRPNSFGLHDVHGNVWEWCRDHFNSYRVEATGGEGERSSKPSPNRPARGGSFHYVAGSTRCANRWATPPGRGEKDLGLRPMRRLE